MRLIKSIKAVTLICLFGIAGYLVMNHSDFEENCRLTKTGVIQNDVIDGLSYSTVPGGMCGKTNENGEFHYKKDDTITFYIGNIKLGGGIAKRHMTTLDLVPGANDHENSKLVNITRLLHSLDTKKQENEIAIPDGIEDVVDSWLISLEGEEFGFDPDNYNFDLLAKDLCVYLEDQMAVYSSGLELVDETDAVEYISESLMSSCNDNYHSASACEDS